MGMNCLLKSIFNFTKSPNKRLKKRPNVSVLIPLVPGCCFQIPVPTSQSQQSRYFVSYLRFSQSPKEAYANIVDIFISSVYASNSFLYIITTYIRRSVWITFGLDFIGSSSSTVICNLLRYPNKHDDDNEKIKSIISYLTLSTINY